MINPKWGQDSIDAPIDGFMMSKKPEEHGRLRSSCSSTSAAPPPTNIYLKTDPNDIGANKHASTAHYTRCRRRRRS